MAELVSWKQIAAYLGVSVKTAQLWERDRGLPVRRLPGARGRVLATTADVDAWRAGTPDSAVEADLAVVPEPVVDRAPQIGPAQRLPRVRPLHAALVLLLAVVLGGVLAARTFLHHGPPSSFVVEGDVLTVRDAEGRRVWRHAFAQPLRTDWYRPVDDHLARAAQFVDLDRDGQPEVLFLLVPRDESASWPLVALSSTGAELWRFVPGRTVKTSSEVFAPPYNVSRYAPISVRGELRVVVTSCHARWWPAQVALLDPAGRVLREYWHSGRLGLLRTADLDGNGIPEIYVADVSNGYSAAALVALDPERFGGASREEDARFQLLGLGAPVERARVLFPRSCVNRLVYPYNSVADLELTRDGLDVHVYEHPAISQPPSIIYSFNRQLQLRAVAVSDRFRGMHQELAAAGELDHQFSPAELGRFRQVRFLTPRD